MTVQEVTTGLKLTTLTVLNHHLIVHHVMEIAMVMAAAPATVLNLNPYATVLHHAREDLHATGVLARAILV